MSPNPKRSYRDRRLTIRRPDDWHVHLRDGDDAGPGREIHRATVRARDRDAQPDAAGDDVAAAIAYRDAHPGRDAGQDFTPLMTCYLTDMPMRTRWCAAMRRACSPPPSSTPRMRRPIPRTASPTSSHLAPARRDAARGMPLLIHGEVTDPDVDIFDREAVFIERTLARLVRDFPALKIVFEHITTAEAADFVMTSAPANVAATITPQHLHINRNAQCSSAAFARTPIACLSPNARSTGWRCAGRDLGSPKFFLGTDSAPHASPPRNLPAACAGIFNAPFAPGKLCSPCSTEDGALDRLEAFASLSGPASTACRLNDGDGACPNHSARRRRSRPRLPGR
jgi:dihydroorotase